MFKKPEPAGVKSGKKFYVIVTGKTNGAHDPIVKKLKHDGHKEVKSPDECDYLLVFCPVVSRPQSDIENGLKRITADKPIILVVMHIHFDPDHVIAESRRQVKDQNVLLTVDYLMYKDALLTDCKLNDRSWDEIQKFLQLPIEKEPPGSKGFKTANNPDMQSDGRELVALERDSKSSDEEDDLTSDSGMWSLRRHQLLFGLGRDSTSSDENTSRERGADADQCERQVQ